MTTPYASPCPDVQISLDSGILSLTLNRPGKKNSLTEAMYAVLADAFEAAESDDSVRVFLIRANGADFTAGNDIHNFVARNEGTATDVEVTRFLLALAQASKPLVAAVKGRAVGIGTTMLLHCDLVYIAEDALLSAPFVDLGLIPEAASSLLLPARIGHSRAFAMFGLGDSIDGTTAHTWGLATESLPSTAVDESAYIAAQRLSNQSPEAVFLTKTLMRAELR